MLGIRCFFFFFVIFVHRKSFRCEMGDFSIYGKKHFRIIKKHFFAIAVLASLEVFFCVCVVYIISFNQRCHQIVF